jgi:hypothetical protein
MLKYLNAEQTKLAKLMSVISEEGHSAGWIQNLEFALWDAINGGNREFGRYVITQNNIDELNLLSRGCGCWIIMDDENEETAIELETWKKKLSNTTT